MAAMALPGAVNILIPRFTRFSLISSLIEPLSDDTPIIQTMPDGICYNPDPLRLVVRLRRYSLFATDQSGSGYFHPLHQRQKERFERWQASGYRHELKPIHEPMPDELRHIPCAAKTRAGTLCKRIDISPKGRCKYPGGHSSGATTPEGKARQLEGYRRWQEGKKLNNCTK